MELKHIVICIIVGLLGLISAGAGFVAALALTYMAPEVFFSSLVGFTCPVSPAMYLGTTAALALVVVQIIINAATRCICCRKRSTYSSDSSWRVAVICFALSWFTFVIALPLLLTGVLLSTSPCNFVDPGLFYGGALLSLTSVALDLTYYVYLASSKNRRDPSGTTSTPNEEGIAMGSTT